jgi:hypothetical protein
MQRQSCPSEDTLADYYELFVNRREYTIQAPVADQHRRHCNYYRAKNGTALSPAVLRRHLEGQITVGLYAIDPNSQRCKWIAIDADYRNAIDDLLRLQWELQQDGVASALERSRRGGHLWMFATQPLLARDCRRYIYQIARRLEMPVRGSRKEQSAGAEHRLNGEGIELFPKQDQVLPHEFGNAIRAPLGIHRATGKRYWFYGADYEIDAQMDYLKKLKKISAEEMAPALGRAELDGSRADDAYSAKAAQAVPNVSAGAKEFSILAEISGRKRKVGRNYFTQCPSCAGQGRDRHGDNLAISVADPRKYCCWAGCTKEQIRAALGRPIVSRSPSPWLRR